MQHNKGDNKNKNKNKQKQICTRSAYECSHCALQDTSYCPLEDGDVNTVCAKIALAGFIIGVCLVITNQVIN